MPTADEVRNSQRATWATLSTTWSTWDALIQRQLGPAGDAIVESLRIAPDAHHLDVASGTGEPGLTIARLAPEGRVVLTDLSAEMLDVAERRAADRGITNVETLVCSADDLPFGDATFDSVSVRFGFMFFPDGDQAAAELARVLKPGGRIAATVWIEPERNPWTTISMQAVASEVEVPAPLPGAPSMFRCAAPGHVSALYETAGLTDVAEHDVPLELVTDSPEQYWEMISDHVSLIAAALKDIGPEARARMRAHAIDAVSAYVRDGQVHVPGLARCIVGTKP